MRGHWITTYTWIQLFGFVVVVVVAVLNGPNDGVFTTPWMDSMMCGERSDIRRIIGWCPVPTLRVTNV